VYSGNAVSIICKIQHIVKEKPKSARNFKLAFIGENGLPHQWCSAQRIKISMIAGGNHTTIQCGLVRNDTVLLVGCADLDADN